MLDHEDGDKIDVALKSARPCYVDNAESVQSVNTSLSQGVGTEVRYALIRAKKGVSNQDSHPLRSVPDWMTQESEYHQIVLRAHTDTILQNRGLTATKVKNPDGST